MRATLPRIAVLAGVLAIIGGAGACESDPMGARARLPESGDSLIVAFDQTLDAWPRDDWDFLDARVAGDSLLLTIAYGGGCEDHDFWLLAVDDFQTLPDAGITPTVAVPFLLAHDAHDDPCEAYLSATQYFSLAPLRAAFRDRITTGPGRILLRVPVGQGSTDTTTVDFTVE